MTLTTHGTVGAALGLLVSGHPVIAFSVGILSHYVLDSIPHIDYALLSIDKKNEDDMTSTIKPSKLIIIDLIRIGLDFFLGICFAAALFVLVTKTNIFELSILLKFLTSSILWGALGGIFPDPLQVSYFLFKFEPFTSVEYFHVWIHANIRYYRSVFVAIGSQLGIVVVILGVVTYLYR